MFWYLTSMFDTNTISTSMIILKEMLIGALGHWLRNYKREYFLENYIFYFFKLEKVLLLMLTLFFLSIFSCLTSAREYRLTKPLY